MSSIQEAGVELLARAPSDTPKSGANRLPSPAKRSILAITLVVMTFAAEAETTTVTIKNLNNEPAQIIVRAGDIVEWRNEDILVHSATARSGDFDLVVQPHGISRLTMSRPGTFDYYCRFHPNMKGTITVRPQ
ncbi:MAG: cupredoxin domain-containing protein [Rhodopila sp.]